MCFDDLHKDLRGPDSQTPSAVDLQLLYALPGLRALHAEVEDATSLLSAEIRKQQPTKEAAEEVYAKTVQVAGGWLGADLSLRPDDGRVHFRVFLEKSICCYILNGHNKQYILVGTIFNYICHCGLQENIFRKCQTRCVLRT